MCCNFFYSDIINNFLNQWKITFSSLDYLFLSFLKFQHFSSVKTQNLIDCNLFFFWFLQIMQILIVIVDLKQFTAFRAFLSFIFEIYCLMDLFSCLIKRYNKYNNYIVKLYFIIIFVVPSFLSANHLGLLVNYEMRQFSIRILTFYFDFPPNELLYEFY